MPPKSNLQVIMKFFASNPPSILILGGILGWILCGFAKIAVFCDYWFQLVLIGVALQIVWMGFRYKK